MPIGIPIRLKRFGGWYTLSEMFLKNQLLKTNEILKDPSVINYHN